MKGRPEPIDIVKLYAKCDTVTWNKFLTFCFERHDVQKLSDVLLRCQLGMDQAVKQGLNTDELCHWFMRIQASLEKTLKRIYRAKNANPLYNSNNKELVDKFIKEKRQADLDFERFLKSTRF